MHRPKLVVTALAALAACTAPADEAPTDGVRALRADPAVQLPEGGPRLDTADFNTTANALPQMLSHQQAERYHDALSHVLRSGVLLLGEPVCDPASPQARAAAAVQVAIHGKTAAEIVRLSDELRARAPLVTLSPEAERGAVPAAQTERAPRLTNPVQVAGELTRRFVPSPCTRMATVTDHGSDEGVTVRFVVSVDGRAEPASLAVDAPGVRRELVPVLAGALAAARFTPGVAGGRAVRTVVEMTFHWMGTTVRPTHLLLNGAAVADPYARENAADPRGPDAPPEPIEVSDRETVVQAVTTWAEAHRQFPASGATVRFVVAPDGGVDSATVRGTPRGIDAEEERMAVMLSMIEFWPAKRGGRPVAARVEIPLHPVPGRGTPSVGAPSWREAPDDLPSVSARRQLRLPDGTLMQVGTMVGTPDGPIQGGASIGTP